MNILYNRNSTVSITSDILIGSGAASGHYDTYYTYDRMGNITSLTRIGLTDGAAYSIIDNLDCAYEGNRLTKVEDSAAGSGQPTYYGAFHFNDGADSDLEYAYDANGNMTKDLNKDSTEIKYNLMNLPKKVTNRSGMESFTYSAAGEKLAMTYSIYMHAGGLYAYCGNFIYHNGGLNRVLVDGGYITFTGWNPQYHFYLTDHLGNNRVVVGANGTVEQVNHYYPYGGLMGESSGGSVQPYKYNGKELERMNGLDLYDYGARWMDGALGRFTTIDPMCEKYYGISPYAYCMDNPIMLVDPDGRKVFANDNYAIRNIINTLSVEEAKYIRFDSHGLLDVNLMNSFNSTSNNYTALLTLAQSEQNYIFSVSDKDVNGKLFFEINSNVLNPNNYSYGVTHIPNAEFDPSPDNNVYIVTASFLSEEQQAKNTAHEGYGHGYFYELSKTNSSIDPNHQKVVVKTEYEYDENTKTEIPTFYFNSINYKLEEQIKKVEDEAVKNYNSRH